MEVTFDRTEARRGELIRARLFAERVGFRGYGMMIGELGLPPGADVDRGALEEVLAGANGVERYEVLPDRILFYLWPKAGGVSFDFVFSASTAMQAKSAASLLYDYNNPEALAEVLPASWNIR